MKKCYILLILLPFLQMGLSQSIELQTLSSVGGGNDVLAFTFGEAVTGGNGILSQGFHQGKLTITPVHETGDLTGIRVYPNPVRQDLIIDSKNPEPMEFLLIDPSGKVLYKSESSLYPHFVNVGMLDSGNYFLQIKRKDLDSKTFKIIKLN